MADRSPLTDAELRSLRSLIHDACEDIATPAELEQLRVFLERSDEAVRVYVQMMYMAVSVKGWARQTSEASKHTIDRPIESCESLALQLAKDEVARMILRNTRPASPEVAARRERSWWNVATMVAAACLLLVGAVWVSNRGGEQLATLPDGASGEGDLASHTTPSNIPPITRVSIDYVAHVVDATGDVQWATRSAPFDYGLRVGVGEPIAVESGVLRLSYFSGATIIVHGPAVFTPTGPESGHLASGRITGRVNAEGGVGFRLTTPSADVLDLGTEFGVAVNDASATEVCVFDGEVEVGSSVASLQATSPVRLTQGMSLRMSASGIPDRTSRVDHGQFLRSMPAGPNSALASNEVSLVDAIIGGAGLSHRLYGALDPTTGKVDEQPLRGGRMADQIGFHYAVYHEFVDGLFIPHREGMPTRIDSYGNAVEFPANLSRTEGPVWARRPLPNWAPGDAVLENPEDEQWGNGATRNVCQRLAECQLGIVGLHSNVGISFEAHSIQAVEGRAVQKFRCLVANLDSTHGERTNGNGSHGSVADFRVYVDGVERCVVPAIHWQDGDQLVELELGTHSRIVTVVVTDSDMQVDHDEVVMIDPVLVLSE
ncbi:hypothetical protein [Aeoliella sp. SH292]|uniref:hypothetical protein n=1 Tax=Aeoliella sp. SH292 TaxID=3454464 RepID=UPI003F9B5CE7